MNEDDIIREANSEFQKLPEQLARDIIREVNTLPPNPAGEKENLDIIKHLLKRIALHQLVLDKRIRCLTIILCVFAAIQIIIMLKGCF